MTVALSGDLLRGPDTHSNRPAATAVGVGTVYECTTHSLLYRSTGAAWVTYAAVVPPGGTSGQALTKNSSTDYDASWSTVSGGGGSAVGANIAVNGRFRINQRAYASATDVASGVYGFDRWKATTASSRMTFTAAPQGQSVTIASGDSWGQVVERANVPAGSYVLSWAGTATARVYNVGGTAPSYAASPVTVTLDGLADVLLEFGPGTLDMVKFETGSTATAYVQPSISGELAACQRYYWRTYAGVGVGVGGGGGTSVARWALAPPASMRATPTLNMSGFSCYDGVNVGTVTATPSTNYSTAAGLAADWTVSTTQTAGRAVAFFPTTPGTGYFEATAEL
jgi:hypothetical protein